MANQPRVTKVLAYLLLSMTAGAIVLLALGNNPPSAGPFCLSTYYRLDRVEDSIISRNPLSPQRWNSIEIYYSHTKAGNIKQLAALTGLASPDDINCHFVICNGSGGRDGQIMTAEKWLRQWSIVPSQKWYGSNQTIRICIIADGKTVHPTDFQQKRLDTLTEVLSRKFNIQRQNIFYPHNWK